MAKGTGDFAHQQVMRQMIPQTKTTAANRGSATPSRDWNPATANLMAVDYDPGSSEANQLNRIKLFMTVAHSRIPQEAQGDHAPASLNESVAQLAERLRDNLKGKLENTIGGSGNSGDEVTNLA